MLYTEMNINQKINFKSWRLSSGAKLSRSDYFPRADELSSWCGANTIACEPWIPDLEKNLKQRWERHPSDC